MPTQPRRPHFSPQAAERLAAQLFGIKAVARPVPSERDQNFHLADAAGREWMLKIANAAEQRAVLDFQNQALRHLAVRDPGLACPQPLPARSGELLSEVQDDAGERFLVRLLTYLPGQLFAHTRPRTPELLHSLGQQLGRLDLALQDFAHPAEVRDLQWDLQQAPLVVRRHLHAIADPARRALVARLLDQYERHAVPALPGLRTSVIHNDANDYNLLVVDQRVAGIIDFGDMLRCYTAAEPAIAAAYAMLDQRDPLAAAGHVLAGYHGALPLSDQELELLPYFILMRLCTSVALSAHQQALEPANSYLSISERPAWALLERLAGMSPRWITCRLRQACGLTPSPAGAALAEWLQAHRAEFGSVLGAMKKEGDFRGGSPSPEIPSRLLVFDLSIGSLELGGGNDWSDASAFGRQLFERMRVAGAQVGVGRYNEARPIYTSALFEPDAGPLDERRTLHLGLDLFVEPGTPVLAPLNGCVHSFRNNSAALDYGPTIVLEHRVAADCCFYTLYGHLGSASLEDLAVGMPIRRGQAIGTVGAQEVNGGWPPHLHFQVIADMLDKQGDFPGVARASERAVWLSLCPDPNLIVNIPPERFPAAPLRPEQILELRRQHLGPSLSISYQRPLTIVRGFMQYLYDENGRAYLDAVNNVPHVGHSHPRVVRAAAEQMAVLNTNTRYLHPNLAEYTRRLCATLPEPLRVCFLVCSGSEANDLALRLAYAHTGGGDLVVVDGAYHGNLSSLVEISPYKFAGPGGAGAPPHVHTALMPDPYRGAYRANDPQAGAQYATHVQAAITQAEARGRGVAAFFCESLLGCGGQIVLPEGYLREAYRHVRAAGGVCIADEVQVGFGRVGTHFWGFETQGVVPDIVTLGKPIGNGHPMAAVITTPAIAASFANGMEYFNTFGGNPVSCAVGLAVLDVIEAEQLQQNALQVGQRLLTGLEALKQQHALIGDVRGLGLYVGVELVRDRQTLAPAAAEASAIAEQMKERGILISTDGPLHNVLKIKPPLVFDAQNADLLVSTLDAILSDTRSA